MTLVFTKVYASFYYLHKILVTLTSNSKIIMSSKRYILYTISANCKCCLFITLRTMDIDTPQEKRKLHQEDQNAAHLLCNCTN